MRWLPGPGAKSSYPPLIPWIDQPDYRRTRKYKRLSSRMQALCDAFHTDGYLVLEDTGILDEIDMDGLSQFVETHFTPESGRVVDGWIQSVPIRQIAAFPPIRDLLRVLYGREPVPFQTLNFVHGTEQATHSDSIHFSCLPSRFMCGVWVALEDILLRQGPLHYYPGSHKLPELDYSDLEISEVDRGPAAWINPDAADRYRAYEQKIGIVAATNAKRSELSVKKGGVLIWSSNLLHGGSLIGEKGSSRKSQVTHFYFEDCVYITPMFSNVKENRFAIRTPFNIATGTPTKISLSGETVIFRPAGDRMTFDTRLELRFDAESAAEYLRRYPDVQASTIFGSVSGAWNHYVIFGDHEGRKWG